MIVLNCYPIARLALLLSAHLLPNLFLLLFVGRRYFIAVKAI